MIFWQVKKWDVQSAKFCLGLENPTRFGTAQTLSTFDSWPKKLIQASIRKAATNCLQRTSFGT
jgi:hypothetical protein